MIKSNRAAGSITVQAPGDRRGTSRASKRSMNPISLAFNNAFRTAAGFKSVATTRAAPACRQQREIRPEPVPISSTSAFFSNVDEAIFCRRLTVSSGSPNTDSSNARSLGKSATFTQRTIFGSGSDVITSAGFRKSPRVSL
jgi:hypothetical protein